MFSRIFAVMVLLLFAVAVHGGPVLDVVETAGDYYTITAQDSDDHSIKYWQIKVDILSGGIYSFKDMTDAGDGSGGHTDYLGAGAYNRNCTLIYFDGRTGNVGTRRGPLAGLAIG